MRIFFIAHFLLTLIKQGFGAFTAYFPPTQISHRKILARAIFLSSRNFFDRQTASKSIALILHFRGLIFAILPTDPKLFVFSVFCFCDNKKGAKQYTQLPPGNLCLFCIFDPVQIFFKPGYCKVYFTISRRINKPFKN